MQSSKRNAIILCTTLFLYISCDVIVDEMFDCIINKHPSLSLKLLNIGEVGTLYYDEIWGEVKNEPLDNNYDYYFDVYGVLPEGLEIIIESRRVVIEGIPRESGRFEITVELFVDGEYWDEENGYWTDDLCSTETTRSYALRINPDSQSSD